MHPGRGDFAVKNMTLLREYLGISAGEKVYLACDTTLLGTCKYGYAFAESGVYSRRYGGMEFISWEIFADSGFRPFDIGSLESASALSLSVIQRPGARERPAVH